MEKETTFDKVLDVIWALIISLPITIVIWSDTKQAYTSIAICFLLVGFNISVNRFFKLLKRVETLEKKLEESK